MPKARVGIESFLGVTLLAALIAPATARAGCLPATITDVAYIGVADGNDGTGADAGMICCDDERLNLFPGVVKDVNVSLAVTQTWVGDLVAKVKSPTGTVSTVFSRPGLAEAGDGAGNCCGNGNDWEGATVLFDEQSGGPSTETMGNSAVVCTGNGVCEYTPEQDTGPGSGLDVDFDGETYVGLWEVCIGDGASGDEGTWNNYNLDVVIDRTIPCLCAGKFRGGDRVRYVGGGGSLPIDTEGEVMCANTSFNNAILASWDGWEGHDGNGIACSCPTGTIPDESGWWVLCTDMEFVLPFSDGFETGNFIRWSSVQTGVL